MYFWNKVGEFAIWWLLVLSVYILLYYQGNKRRSS